MSGIKHSTGVIHDIEQITPYVGMTGLYSVRDPYTALIKSDIEYTCTSVINISGAIANGVDVKETIYLANNDTEQKYTEDFNKNSTIITLQSSRGDIITIPTSALNGLPNANGINYVSVLLGVSLSIIPDSLDLTNTMDRIKDIVKKDLGVESTIYPTVLGGSLLLSYDKHDAIETARQAMIDEASNTIIENERLKSDIVSYQQKIQMLENYIRINLPPNSNP